MSRVWLNGGLVDAATARIDPADRGLLLADGVFETLRVEHRVPLDAGLHWQRLATGASVLGQQAPGSALLDSAVGELIAANRIESAALRVTLTRGPGPRGLVPPAAPSPTLLIVASPLPASPPPARAAVVSMRRNEHSPLSRIKSLAYLDQILALREAQARGRDEAILLNTTGWVACASAGNLFVRHGDRLRTPPCAQGVLAGITRARVLAANLPFELTETGITVAELHRADEVLVTSSLVGVRSVIEIDGTVVGDGRPGPAAALVARAIGRG